MNREIKFRVYDPEVKAVYVVENWEELMMSDVMQFTGLKDKNGKEIYEGDVVEYDFEPCGKQTGVFQFSEGWFCLKGHNNWRPLECKVIGNIYENPDLLLKTKREV